MSVNVSKQKRDRLVEKINKIKKYVASAKQDENTARLLTYIADIEKDIKGKKYGLVFEEHREAIDEILEQNTPVLTEEKDLFIDNGGQMNFLIEGDNLAALQLLEKTHKGKIDLIYIDPPYNTGNKDFIYDDNFVDDNDGYKHSKWISFIEKKLKIAHKLLGSDGFILISINDIELCNLRLLCNQIFGENNFLANMIWQSTPGSNTGLDIKTVTEYVVCYAKNKATCATSSKPVNDKGKYNLEDEYVSERGKYILNKLDRRMTGQHYSDALNYQIEMPDGTFLYPGNNVEKPQNWNWRWSKTKVEWGKENGYIIFKKSKEGWAVYFKQYYLVDNNGLRINRSLPYQNLIKDLDGANSARGTQEVMDIFQSKAFDYPKPLNLIKYLLDIHKSKSLTILDFFAGSGTTGHAVMKLNAEDGGKRKFILCTNNENNICRDVTYERIKRVIARDKYEASLKYYKVDFVPISDKLYYEYADELLKHIRELVELENGINFNGNAEIAIVLTEKELDEFTTSIPDKCKTIYLGHDVLPSEEQESMFKARGIAVNIIPDYYYRELEG